MKDGTYVVRMDEEGVPILANQINMSDGYWVSDDTGIAVHGGLDESGILDALSLMDVEDGEVIGIWENEGIAYVDRSYHFRKSNTALKVAKAFEQLSVYDCSNRKLIWVK